MGMTPKQKAQTVEVAGFVILLVAAFVWSPLVGLIVLGVGAVVFAQMMRRV